MESAASVPAGFCVLVCAQVENHVISRHTHLVMGLNSGTGRGRKGSCYVRPTSLESPDTV